MKLLGALFFTSLALALPTSLEVREQTVVGTISDAIDTLKSATSDNLATINKTVDGIKDDVSSQVEAKIAASLKTNYMGIINALQDATKSISSVTSGSAGSIGSSAQNLGQEEVDQLTEALQTASQVFSQIGAAADISATDLSPALKNAVQSETAALKQAVQPLVTPLQGFAAAARAATAAGSVKVTGLKNAADQFGNVVKNIAGTLGLPSVGSM